MPNRGQAADETVFVIVKHGPPGLAVREEIKKAIQLGAAAAVGMGEAKIGPSFANRAFLWGAEINFCPALLADPGAGPVAKITRRWIEPI